MLTVKGKVAKLLVKKITVGALFNWQLVVDSGRAELSSKQYWIDSDSPRVRFVECELVFDTQVIRTHLDLGKQHFYFDMLAEDEINFECENVNLRKRGENERIQGE